MLRIIKAAATAMLIVASSAFTGLKASAASPDAPMGSNFYAYPDSGLPALTPAPEGYRPFHIEHYGRHGSRWHIGRGIYSDPVEILSTARRHGRLTPRGEQLLDQLTAIERASRGRDGELTPKGARQHRGIASRMMANFPEIFADSLHIVARSTPVVRCILSMESELRTMAAANPTFTFDVDASYADIDLLNPTDTLTSRYSDKAYNTQFVEFEKRHPFSYDFLDRLFTDRHADSFVADSLKPGYLLWSLFNIAANTQSHDDQPDLFDIFTPAEIAQKWRHTNLDWFLRSGNTAHSDNMTPFSQHRLLHAFIDGADSAIASGSRVANLRFGHEVVVLPVAVLMEMDDYGREINNLEAVDSLWRNYEIFPMAANIQLLFYRKADGGAAQESPVLVKALLNEREVRLPAGEVDFPYYDWATLRRYWLDKLTTWEEANLPRNR